MRSRREVSGPAAAVAAQRATAPAPAWTARVAARAPAGRRPIGLASAAPEACARVASAPRRRRDSTTNNVEGNETPRTHGAGGNAADRSGDGATATFVAAKALPSRSSDGGGGWTYPSRLIIQFTNVLSSAQDATPCRGAAAVRRAIIASIESFAAAARESCGRRGRQRGGSLLCEYKSWSGFSITTRYQIPPRCHGPGSGQFRCATSSATTAK